MRERERKKMQTKELILHAIESRNDSESDKQKESVRSELVSKTGWDQ